MRVEVEPLHERTFTAVPVRLPSRAAAGWAATLDSVTVRVRGRAARLATLDADSIVVLAEWSGRTPPAKVGAAGDHAAGRERTGRAGQCRDRSPEGRVAEWILGIETSCDETSAAVLRTNGGRPELAGLVILSQDVHRIFGGVVPELASRAHVQAIGSVVDRALADAGIGLPSSTASR